MMKKLLKSLRLLLVAVGLCVGAGASWADVVETIVVNCDFENSETLFTGASRMGVANEANEGNGSKVVKFSCANNSQNGYSLATYNFSSAIGDDATMVKVAFDFYIPNVNAAYRRFFTVGEAGKRTGFGKQSYVTTGSMFAFGLARNSSANYFSINGASTTADASATNVLAAWAHAEITVNHSVKTVSYAITSLDGSTTYYSGKDITFADNDAAYCNQLDFFDCQNNVVSYLDNLVITKYVDQSKVSTTYTVKYQDGSGNDLKDAASYSVYVGDTFTASATDMATFYSSDNAKKYVYASGNESKTASATASENVVTLVFNTYDKISYTITAKDGEDTLATLKSGDAYADGSTTVYWSKYIKVGDVWYETTGNYGKVITEAGNTDIAFSASNICYFVEAENINKTRSAAANKTGVGYSGGETQRHYANSTWWTAAFPQGGKFILTFPYTMNSTSASSFTIQTRDAAGNLTETGLELNTNKGGTFSEEITIPAGSSVALVKGEYNSNILIDYLTLTPLSVEATVTSAGWATLYTDYALDFSSLSDDLTAYTATVSGNAVTLTAVENVPAGTGVVLKGAAKDYEIPVAAASATDKGSLKGSTTEALTYSAEAANDYYILALNGDGKAQFTKLTSGTLAAGKAYLELPKTAARTLRVVFGDEATGIAQVENGRVKSEDYFNLQGQRIAKPVKGLYVKDGRKVIVK